MHFIVRQFRACAIVLAAGLVCPVLAQPLTGAFTYQGQLTASGVPASGLYDLRFRLYDAAAGGNQIGSTLCADNVTVTSGVFTVSLDFGIFTGQQRFLEIEVRQDTGLDCSNAAGFTLLITRQALTVAPQSGYAVVAGNAISATSAVIANSAGTAALLNGQPASYYTNAANLTGTLPGGVLSGSYSGAVTFSNPASSFIGSGAGLTGLNAASISSGLLSDSRLTTNIPRLNAANAFTNAGTNSFAGTVSAANLLASSMTINSPSSPIAAEIDSSSTIGTWLNLYNSTIGGTYWRLISSGSGNGEGAGKLLISTGGGAGLSGAVATFQTNGFFGLGTYTPAQRLDVRGDAQVQGTVRLDGTDSPLIVRQYDAFTTGGKTGFGRWGLFQEPSKLFLGVAGTDYSGTSSIGFGGWLANSTRQDWMTIVEGGNVGIGTTAPVTTLDVNGTVNVRSGLIHNGTTALTGSSDLGLYSQTSGAWMRFVTTSAPFKWYTDGGVGTTPSLTLFSDGSLTSLNDLNAGRYLSVAKLAVISGTGLTNTNSLTITAPTGTSNGINVQGNTSTNYPILFVSQSGAGSAAYFGGIMSGSDKRFRIDHPLDPANKYLDHSCVESNERLNLYTGTVVLDGQGEATISLPSYFEALNRDFSYQLTPIGRPALGLYIAEEIADGHFKVAGGMPGMKLSWMVTGIRQDAYAKTHPFEAEQDKGPDRGKYLRPQDFGMPESMGGAMQAPRPVTTTGTETETRANPMNDR